MLIVMVFNFRTNYVEGKESEREKKYSNKAIGVLQKLNIYTSERSRQPKANLMPLRIGRKKNNNKKSHLKRQRTYVTLDFILACFFRDF
jgi:hypothetical protein